MSANRSYSFGDCTLDLARGALVRSGADVRLRPKSFDVLRQLVERHGQLVTKEELLDAVWGRTVVTDGETQRREADQSPPAPPPASPVPSLRRGVIAAVVISLVPIAIWWGL